jgi:hypothetical protein
MLFQRIAYAPKAVACPFFDDRPTNFLLLFS